MANKGNLQKQFKCNTCGEKFYTVAATCICENIHKEFSEIDGYGWDTSLFVFDLEKIATKIKEATG